MCLSLGSTRLLIGSLILFISLRTEISNLLFFPCFIMVSGSLMQGDDTQTHSVRARSNFAIEND